MPKNSFFWIKHVTESGKSFKTSIPMMLAILPKIEQNINRPRVPIDLVLVLRPPFSSTICSKFLVDSLKCHRSKFISATRPKMVCARRSWHKLTHHPDDSESIGTLAADVNLIVYIWVPVVIQRYFKIKYKQCGYFDKFKFNWQFVNIKLKMSKS